MKRSFDAASNYSQDIWGEFSLDEFTTIYPKEWLAVAVLAEDQGRPTRGYLLAHSQDRARVEQKLRSFPNQRILFFYNGAQPKIPTTSM